MSEAKPADNTTGQTANKATGSSKGSATLKRPAAADEPTGSGKKPKAAPKKSLHSKIAQWKQKAKSAAAQDDADETQDEGEGEEEEEAMEDDEEVDAEDGEKRHAGKSRQYKKAKERNLLPDHIINLIVTTIVLLVFYCLVSVL